MKTLTCHSSASCSSLVTCRPPDYSPLKTRHVRTHVLGPTKKIKFPATLNYSSSSVAVHASVGSLALLQPLDKSSCCSGNSGMRRGKNQIKISIKKSLQQPVFFFFGTAVCVFDVSHRSTATHLVCLATILATFHHCLAVERQWGVSV